MKKLLKYFIESKNELLKVVWPTRRKTLEITFAVVVLSLVVSFFLGIVDLGFLKALEFVFK